MPDNLLNAAEVAERLGVTRLTSIGSPTRLRTSLRRPQCFRVVVACVGRSAIERWATRHGKELHSS